MADEAIADDASSDNNDFGAAWKFTHLETPELKTTTSAREVARIGFRSISVQYHWSEISNL